MEKALFSTGEEVLITGNEAIGEAAVRAGCRYFFGYPITPQSELPAYLSRRLPQVGGVFLQAESEIAAIYMVHGAGGSGARVLTSSSGPGISLKQEGLSFITSAEIPAVVVNMSRGGPGLGSIGPAQSDYFQATKGGGHGDYHPLVLAPATVQEAVDLTMLAYELADQYRNPVMILGDGILGQMMEPVVFPEAVKLEELPPKTWTTTGAKGRRPNVVSSLHADVEDNDRHNLKLQAKYRRIENNEQRWEVFLTEDAEYLIAAFGTVARIAKTAIRAARAEGIPVGLFRPVSLYPYPYAPLEALARKVKFILTAEMNYGQMVDDVKLAAKDHCPVHFVGRAGGAILPPREILGKLRELVSGEK